MKPLFIHYPKCGTCRKAAKWLAEQGIEAEGRDITLEKPTAAELKNWIPMSGLPVQKFFNTSGLLYKEMNLKDKLKGMSESEMIALLATDGKLVKRPVVVLADRVLVGFKEDEWRTAFGR